MNDPFAPRKKVKAPELHPKIKGPKRKEQNMRMGPNVAKEATTVPNRGRGFGY